MHMRTSCRLVKWRFFFFIFVVVVRQLLSPLGVARLALNNGLAVIMTSRDRFYEVSQILDILVT